MYKAAQQIFVTATRTQPMTMSVVLPVFSERKSSVQIIQWLRAKCREYLHEIIIVLAPQSDQETKNICQDMAARYGVKIVV